jgi:hypothetical protein
MGDIFECVASKGLRAFGCREMRREEEGIHPPRHDEKSAEAIERKRVERATSGKRVRKIQKRKRLNIGG